MSPQQQANAVLRRWQALRHMAPAERIELLDVVPVEPALTEEQFQVAQSDVAWEMSRA
jgi:hypothetical protein